MYVSRTQHKILLRMYREKLDLIHNVTSPRWELSNGERVLAIHAHILKRFLKREDSSWEKGEFIETFRVGTNTKVILSSIVKLKRKGNFSYNLEPRRAKERKDEKPQHGGPRPREWYEEVTPKILEMRRAKVTMAEMAEKLDTSKGVIRRILRKHDMVRPYRTDK